MADVPGFEPEERLDDPCIADLPGVVYACCGHGHSGKPVYVVGVHGPLYGPDAARKMRELGGNPPPQAFYLDPLDEEPSTA